MKETEILLQETELFNVWREITPNLSEDGLIDPVEYVKSDIKILFLLKEVNSDKGFNLKQFVNDGGRTQTWDNVSRWTHGILNWQNDFSWLDDIEPIKNIAKRKELLKYVSVMNIKKTPGGHTTNIKKLIQDSTLGKSFLERQFRLYFDNADLRPDFIIACGGTTSRLFRSIVPIIKIDKWSVTKRGVLYYEYEKGKYFIEYAHPEARVADNLLYYGLVDAVRELKLKNSNLTST
ncbi:hypothetical protein [Cytophaga sp. FL35]|uniref:hypothetical protein n=1 Tax=Cytophaga sp. FL35 TaxID=1904456 RepID=UPI0016534E9F|nr:hypothetical protein [Cytophaga sp. FL35]MBC7000700.1 hypothetical protein [Cytophaga sp. FL35]